MGQSDQSNLVAKGKLGNVEEAVAANNISFTVTSAIVPILELRGNGDILVKGKVIENDIEVVQALREFLTSQGLIE
jgi:hypothetical protein